MSVKKGEIYPSKVWLEADNKTPLKMKVTSIKNGVIYYRPVYEDGTIGKPVYCSVEDVNKYLNLGGSI